MFITADQLICHMIGDYVLQSDWMANEKTKKSVAALAHVISYSLPFLFLRPSLLAWLFIVVTHFVIDRWRLARFLVYAKNFLSPKFTWSPNAFEIWWHSWSDCADTGYHKTRPAFMAVWLMIIADNVLHVICNAVALKYL